MKNISSRILSPTKFRITVFLCATFLIATITFAAPIDALPPSEQHQVTGTVTDPNGLPIPGVAVRIKNSSTGTVTNPDGVYTINADFDDILVFTYLGFQTVEVPIDSRVEINISLEEDVTTLNEVEINAGYYHTTRRESTGNISRVTAEEIELQPVVSPIQALQGRMAGVEITPGPGGHPGTASTIRIRGTNSLRAEGNFPFYIIDGVPVNSTPIESNSSIGLSGIDPLNSINLSDIKSIEILKDADATAIYGSRGANGVVLLTTKKGHSGKVELEAGIYSGSATVPNRLNLLNTKQHLQIRQKAFQNDGIEPNLSNAYDLMLFDHNRYTDWQDFFFGGTSSINNVNLAASGGTENTSFRLSGSFHTQGTVFPGDYNYNKITTGLNFNHSSNDNKLRLRVSLNYGIDNNKLGDLNFTNKIFALAPNAPQVFNEDGSLSWTEWEEAGLDNPLMGFFNSSNTDINNLVSSLGIEYEIREGLILRSNFGYTFLSNREIIKRPKRSINPSYWNTSKHASNHLHGTSTSWIIEPQLIYKKNWKNVNLDALIGGTLQSRNQESSTFQGEGYVTEALIGNLTAAESLLHARSQNSRYRYAAIFGRLGINWQERYYLNLTGRHDGSSRFGPGKKTASFWAIGGAWIFIEDPDALVSYGKFRGSYGTTGNDQIGNYGYFDAYEATPGPGGLHPTQLSNPNYSWEINKKFESALELGLFKDKVNISMNWYRNRSSNQLVGYALPAITGFTSVNANLPATVENQGWEFELRTSNINRSNFFWRTSFHITLPNNKLIEYPNIEQSSYFNRYKVGHPLDISLLYENSGFDPETGFYAFTDVNGDGRLDYADRTVIHHNGKELFGGMHNQLRYKNFSLQFLIDFVKHKGSLHLFEAGGLGAQRSDVIQALKEDSEFQKISTTTAARTAYSNALNSDLPYVDASFLRLKSLSIGYQLPSSLLDIFGIKGSIISLTGQNLFTLTDYKGIDPEIPNSGMTISSLRTITASFQLKI